METKHIKTKIFSVGLLIVMLLTTGVVYKYIRKNIQQQGRAKFESQSQAVANAINIRLNRDTHFLYSLRGLYSASKSVERNEFKAFGDGSQLAENFPGIYAIEFIEKVSAGDKDSFVESVKNDTSLKSEGYPEFKIYPEENKDNFFVLKYFYPEEKDTASSLGFDMSTEKNRSMALEEALKSDRPSIAGRVKIIGTENNENDFVLFLPIYKNDFPIATEAERRENLSGFVGVVIDIEKFIDSIIQSEKADWNNFDMYVYDQAPNSGINSSSFLYDVDKEEEDESKAGWSYFYDIPLNIADKTWTLHFVADPDYGINNLEFAMMGVLILFGVFFSFFISGSFYFLGTSRSRALILAEEMTQDLRSSEERYRALFIESRDAMMTTSLGGGFISGNPATLKMFGCQDEKDFIAKSPAELSPEYQPDGVRSSDKAKKMMAVAIEQGSNLFEWTHRRMDGTEFSASVLLSRMEKDGKQFLQATVRDITAQKQAEEEIKKKNEELERVNKLMVGREIKMTELKKEINELKKQKDV